ncbi:hypothetical protein COV05_00840 [Candidatus Uhrbacteria bacterium CG10_big_fil_rev_8_21_14_0_10_48_16]|uniref:Uncharacterized protein n=1 Tax=Candidatus Uhrbacteria bacterium CG10_big_fil_rev_8_21_14_0_10_48_16 TaxID=1975038 RepID=A0A2M8LI73_9BACT|nr:MAG: hypothetical protein COV05_00840 [Candidatus Uhrbacteria bacterium CG10_big_fil_rev_8_21_14_0_10_48_16]
MNTQLSIQTLALTLIFALAPSWVFASTPSQTIGRILLQVEEAGEAWYVTPDTQERVYIKNGNAAYAVLRNFGLGITNENLAKIPVGFEDRFEETDTDGDGLSDKLEEGLGTDPTTTDSDEDGTDDRTELENGTDPLGLGELTADVDLMERLKGTILLQVEEAGQAWYVHPEDGHRYYMSNGDSAYQIMRYLSLGITNANLETIPLFSSVIDCDDNLDCMLSAVEGDIQARVTSPMSLEFFGILLESLSLIEHTPADELGLFTFKSVVQEYLIDGEAQEEMVGLTRQCRYENKQSMTVMLEDWIAGGLQADSFDPIDCETIPSEPSAQ